MKSTDLGEFEVENSVSWRIPVIPPVVFRHLERGDEKRRPPSRNY